MLEHENYAVIKLADLQSEQSLLRRRLSLGSAAQAVSKRYPLIVTVFIQGPSERPAVSVWTPAARLTLGGHVWCVPSTCAVVHVDL